MESSETGSKNKEQRLRMVIVSLALLMFLFAPNAGKSQTWSEWFRQRRTQINYLGKQIIGLNVYAGYLKDGYRLAKSGLTAVKDIRNGEFGLHQMYFSSLKAVNPKIRKNMKVAEIIALQLSIDRQLKTWKAQEYLTPGDLDYIRQVKSQVRDMCNQNLDELALIITSGKVEMDDDERIRRLDVILLSMQEAHAFVQEFSNTVQSLIRHRKDEAHQAETIKQLYTIPE